MYIIYIFGLQIPIHQILPEVPKIVPISLLSNRNSPQFIREPRVKYKLIPNKTHVVETSAKRISQHPWKFSCCSTFLPRRSLPLSSIISPLHSFLPPLKKKYLFFVQTELLLSLT